MHRIQYSSVQVHEACSAVRVGSRQSSTDDVIAPKTAESNASYGPSINEQDIFHYVDRRQWSDKMSSQHMRESRAPSANILCEVYRFTYSFMAPRRSKRISGISSSIVVFCP